MTKTDYRQSEDGKRLRAAVRQIELIATTTARHLVGARYIDRCLDESLAAIQAVCDSLRVRESGQ